MPVNTRLPAPNNPLVADNASETIDRVNAVVSLLSLVDLNTIQNQETAWGRLLMLETIHDALTFARRDCNG